jgi:biopolymer transport protein ExbD
MRPRQRSTPILLFIFFVAACRASQPTGGTPSADAAPGPAGLELPAATRASTAAPDGALVVELTTSALTIAGQPPISLNDGLLAHQDAIDAALRAQTADRALLIRADRRVDAAWVAQLDAIARAAGARSIHAALSDGRALALPAPAPCDAAPAAPPTIDELGAAATPEPACLTGHISLDASGVSLTAQPACEPAQQADAALSAAPRPLTAAAITIALREADAAATLCPQLTLDAKPGASWGDAALVLDATSGVAVALGVSPR